MRKSHVFVGSSHPALGQLICDRLGVEPAPCTLRKFSNGETSIEVGVSVRDEDVYVVQSSSGTTNDHIMEMLILISGCRGGSANKITAVIPMFPYSKQSKMKKHRGAITAKMLANLLIMAGADHVITMDLHATQMQGFFTKPVDNLIAIPTLARWIKHHIPNYSEDVVIVSKNPGGTKRVTALADALKIDFAMIHTDRRRTKGRPLSRILSARNLNKLAGSNDSPKKKTHLNKFLHAHGTDDVSSGAAGASAEERTGDDEEEDLSGSQSIQVGRVIDGHVVDDDYEPEKSDNDETSDQDASNDLSASVYSNNGKELHHALGGTVTAQDSDDEDDIASKTEQLIALVGDVRDRVAVILDDMIDRPNSFIAAAEHCAINCGAKAVYVVATHGVFSDGSLAKLTACKHIDHIVVTNTYPISGSSEKLTVIDISPIFAECIRRNHNGESISALFDQLIML